MSFAIDIKTNGHPNFEIRGNNLTYRGVESQHHMIPRHYPDECVYEYRVIDPYDLSKKPHIGRINHSELSGAITLARNILTQIIEENN